MSTPILAFWLSIYLCPIFGNPL
ncbi:hypothetical protein RHECNPAF_1330037 [Rhizobium etli CNPAF512]|nr:hypothetical protein RHECNPAF_1330037 [Rhizobium etli CNPAF512]